MLHEFQVYNIVIPYITQCSSLILTTYFAHPPPIAPLVTIISLSIVDLVSFLRVHKTVNWIPGMISPWPYGWKWSVPCSPDAKPKNSSVSSAITARLYLSHTGGSIVFLASRLFFPTDFLNRKSISHISSKIQVNTLSVL